MNSSTPQPTVRALALDFLADDQPRIDAILAGKKPVTDGGKLGQSGPLRPYVRITARGLTIEQYTPEAWATQVAYEAYCKTHGVWGKAAYGRPDSPPPTKHDHVDHDVSWTQLREWLQADQADEQQMALAI